MTSLLERISGSSPVRAVADSFLQRYSAMRVGELDRVDPVTAQLRTLRRLVQKARNTRFGVDHDFDNVRTISDYQRRVPLRSYEQMWKDYWEAVYPRLQGVSWPDFTPYYALSSGTTSAYNERI